jgi:phosphoglycerate dehydrogenase-like enzyme
MKLAILDDYQNVALALADWSAVEKRATITVFHDRVDGDEAIVARLLPFDAICVMRERTPLPRRILERLPRLKLIASTGPRNAVVDTEAARQLGITITDSGYFSSPAVELTWALILAGARHLVEEAQSVRDGGWQMKIGTGLAGKVLGIVGLGNIGGSVARIGAAFGMNVIAWSENLTAAKAESLGARYVSKEQLFRTADVVTIHVILSRRTKGLVGLAELDAMKPTAMLVNTSRGPIVDEAALIRALERKTIAGAALDVFDEEPLPLQHPFRTLENVLATPHIGYVTEDLYRTFYRDVVASVASWLDSQPNSQ